MWDHSLHPKPHSLPSSFSTPCLWQLLALYCPKHQTPTSRGAMGSFAWILPPHYLPALPSLSPPIFSCDYEVVIYKFNCSLWPKNRNMLESSSLSKLLAKGHTQNIKVIICDFCSIFLCSVPIFL